MLRLQNLIPCVSVALLAACTILPTGPSVLVLPGTTKNFDQFRGDDVQCRQFAYEEAGGATPARVAADSGVRSAAVGTALGAIAGAAIGGGRGAGVGAATGLIIGGTAGVGAAEYSESRAQRRYDFAYVQCMYAKGHRVPVSGRFTGPSPRAMTLPPPPPGMPPPPPPGMSPSQ